jgi:signal transduction histidine kinase
MLPGSHLVPINDQPAGARLITAGEPEMHRVLASAFTAFISASSRLENSYRQLQQEVCDLRLELAARNAALNNSLAENDRMRLHLQQIVDSMPCGVLVLDHEGQISMLNPESGRLLGLDPTQFGKTLPQISAFCGVNLEGSCENETGRDFCLHHASFGKRWIELRNRRLVEPGKPNQTIMILRDVTAQRRAEEEREAGRKAMALAEITTILAHEIRNPLASLELFAELIEGDEHRRSEWIAHLRAGIRSLSSTVNNVLSFHGSGSLKLAPASLAVVIGSAIKFVQPLAHQAEVFLRWCGDQDATLVMGNESALQQVILNLISNAIRHTSPGGSVTISLRAAPNSEVIVEFADTGCGIRSDQIEHIFEAGYSGGGDTSGLGLAVCERIMKQHGGKISVVNLEHAGAQFALHFPILQEQLAPA